MNTDHPGLFAGAAHLRVRVKKITPVLIVQEPVLRWDFNWLLNSLFKRLLRRARVTRAVEVMPLQVIDIESLEKMRPNLIEGDFRLEQCLNARAPRPEIDKHLLSIRARGLRGLRAARGPGD